MCFQNKITTGVLSSAAQPTETKGRSRRCNFAPWDKGQCPHEALFHAVPGCIKYFLQCRIDPKCQNSRMPSYLTLLEAFAAPWDSVEQCSMGTLSLVSRSKVASYGPTLSQPDIAGFF